MHAGAIPEICRTVVVFDNSFAEVIECELALFLPHDAFGVVDYLLDVGARHSRRKLAQAAKVHVLEIGAKADVQHFFQLIGMWKFNLDDRVEPAGPQ